MGDDVIQVRSFETIFVMRGKSIQDLFPQLIPLLDGENTLDDIFNHLPHVEREVIVSALLKFSHYFMLEDAANDCECKITDEESMRSGQFLNFFSHFSERQLPGGESVNKYALLSKLKSSKCLIVGLGCLGVTILDSLAASNVGTIYGYDFDSIGSNDIGRFYSPNHIGKDRVEVAKDIVNRFGTSTRYVPCDLQSNPTTELEKLIQNADIVIMSRDIMLRSEYGNINDLCIQYKKPWISARIGETEMEVGPLVIPGQTPCFECYTARINGNMSFFEENMEFESFKENNAKKWNTVL
jgi:hypothetical protein